MVQLYLEEYSKNLVGKRVCIGCREGILRNYFGEIVADIKFLSRRSIKTTLFHNLPNRLANQKLIKDLKKRLPDTRQARISPEADFYEAVLAHPDIRYKILFLERQYLKDHQGNKINTLTTTKMRESFETYGSSIGNVNFKGAMELICEKIEASKCERIHILPAGKNSIKHELFTVEGSGTMIANNFVEDFRQVKSDEEVAIVNRILSMYKGAGYLKPRTKEYVDQKRCNFYVTEIDNIAVGCVERKKVDENTVELGALAISSRFRNQRIGMYTVNSFMEDMQREGFTKFISLTENPRLQTLFKQLGFKAESRQEYQKRQDQSPGVQMFFKSTVVFSNLIKE